MMRFRLSLTWGVAVVVVSVRAVLAGGAADTEPNDTLASAVNTGLADAGMVSVPAGEIGNGPLGAGDRDLFAIEVTGVAETPVLLAADALSVGDAFDGYLRVFDAGGAEIARHDDADASDPNPSVRTYLLEPGTYYVGVSHVLNPIYSPADASTGREAGTGVYDLLITLSAAPSLADSLEPAEEGPTPVDALPFVALNQFIGDGQNGRLDVDRYLVAVDGPSIVTVEVTPVAENALDPVVHIDVENTSMFEHDVPRADLAVRRIAVAVLEAGDASVVVRGTRSAPETPPGRLGSVGFYDVTIDVTPVESGGGPHEPNDSLLEATPSGLTGLGSVQFSAVIGDGVFGAFRGDVDYYELPLPIDRTLEVDVVPAEGPNALQPVVEFYSYLGQRISRNLPDASGAVHAALELRCGDVPLQGGPDTGIVGVAIMGARDRPAIDPLVPNPDTYPDPAWPGQPMFTVHALDGGPGSTGGYTVTFTIAPPSIPVCGDEPDDDIGSLEGPVLVDEGTFVCAGSLTEGPCAQSEQHVDLFRITLNAAPAAADILLTSGTCGAGRLVLRLFDATGAELAIDPFALNASLHETLDNPGDYFVGVSFSENDDYDPFVECSGFGYFDPYEDVDRYELEIRLTPIGSAAETAGGPSVAPIAGTTRLFATRLDATADRIVELDPVTGGTIGEMQAPEVPQGAASGVAFDGEALFVLGSGRYPYLYRLDPSTGDVLDRTLTWFGSGVYGDLLVRTGGLFIVDLRERSVYVTPPDLSGSVTRLDVRASGVAMHGAITATGGSNLLVVPDAGDPSMLHLLDPSSGAPVSTLSLGNACGCNADFDGDGDVDGADASFFDGCNAVSGVSFGCQTADLNCDGDIDASDAGILDCQRNGPGVPPGVDCCPDDLPAVSTRATSLAVVGTGELLAGDWVRARLERFSVDGESLGGVSLDAPIGALAGLPAAPFGDGDNDGDVDLLDWAGLQVCFTGSGGGFVEAGCEVFDFDVDQDVDLFDYDAFQAVMTGGGS